MCVLLSSLYVKQIIRVSLRAPPSTRSARAFDGHRRRRQQPWPLFVQSTVWVLRLSKTSSAVRLPGSAATRARRGDGRRLRRLQGRRV